jgi:AhpD family alkylhydroperoxidase
MNDHLDIHTAAPDVVAAMTRFDTAATKGLPPDLVQLVRIRASQLNGCALCRSMHTRAAVDAGEDRLKSLPSWRDSPLFTAPERAALALTEALTLIGDTAAPTDALRDARAYFDETELAHVLWTIAAINAWNRMGIAMARQRAAHQR